MGQRAAPDASETVDAKGDGHGVPRGHSDVALQFAYRSMPITPRKKRRFSEC